MASLDSSTERSIRKANLAILSGAGFVVADSLPLWSEWSGRPLELRPTIEIVRRLMCSEIVTSYIWTPSMAEEEMRQYIERSQLSESMAEVEQEILSRPRTDALMNYRNNDGWRQENQWALAWVLGFEREIGLRDGFIDADVMTPLVQDFMPRLSETDQVFASRVTCRPLQEVAQKFDLFYCAHNAVRSAQNGGDTVPDDFDPVTDGGVLHEKRHALTWCLSPNVSWDETDLAT